MLLAVFAMVNVAKVTEGVREQLDHHCVAIRSANPEKDKSHSLTA